MLSEWWCSDQLLSTEVEEFMQSQAASEASQGTLRPLFVYVCIALRTCFFPLPHSASGLGGGCSLTSPFPLSANFPRLLSIQWEASFLNGMGGDKENHPPPYLSSAQFIFLLRLYLNLQILTPSPSIMCHLLCMATSAVLLGQLLRNQRRRRGGLTLVKAN